MTRHDLPRTPEAHSGPWAHPPRKPERRMLPGWWIMPGLAVSLALSAAVIAWLS